MSARIEYVGRSSRYAQNEHRLRVAPDVTDGEIIEYIERERIDHVSFGASVQRLGETALVSIYTD